jgi:hypothetical protein
MVSGKATKHGFQSKMRPICELCGYETRAMSRLMATQMGRWIRSSMTPFVREELVGHAGKTATERAARIDARAPAGGVSRSAERLHQVDLIMAARVGRCPAAFVVPEPGVETGCLEGAGSKGHPPQVHPEVLPRRKLLQGPCVAVRIAKSHERPPRLNIDLASRHATPDELLPGGRGILDDDLHALLRARRHVRDAGAQKYRAGRPRRSELHEAQPFMDLLVVVGVEADLVDVEGLSPVDVGDGNGHKFDLPVHPRSVTVGSDSQPWLHRSGALRGRGLLPG